MVSQPSIPNNCSDEKDLNIGIQGQPFMNSNNRRETREWQQGSIMVPHWVKFQVRMTHQTCGDGEAITCLFGKEVS